MIGIQVHVPVVLVPAAWCVEGQLPAQKGDVPAQKSLQDGPPSWHTVDLMASPATGAIAAIACAHLFIPGCTWTSATERRGAGPIRFTDASSTGS
jgi:hypothetical protein